MKTLNSIVILAILLFSLNVLAQDPHAESGLKKVIVQEVIQVPSYTYLNVLEDGKKKWIAVPTMEAKIGEIYYYKGGMVMPDFESKELNRKFDAVIFLSSITNAEAIDTDKGIHEPHNTGQNNSKKPILGKLELSIEGIEDGISIAELFKNKKQYEGEKIKIKGEVTKFNGSILGKNWIHFQDGTSFEGAYDLMITTSQDNVSVGDILIFEGVIALDKDFGSGYFYAVIMEEAVLIP